MFSLRAVEDSWAKAVQRYPTMARYYFLSTYMATLEAIQVL